VSRVRSVSRVKSAAGRVALLVCGLALGLGLAEVALRLVDRPPERSADRMGLHELRLDRPWLYRLRPGAQGYMRPGSQVLYRINADGFRDRLYERPKPAERYRVLLLGDSLVFGYEVALEQSFGKLVEAEFARRAPEAGIEVMNFAVPGYNPYTEAELFKELGASYQPDLVVVQFCSNDLADPTSHFSLNSRRILGSIPDAAYPDPENREDPLRGDYIGDRLCRNSRLCGRVEDALQRLFGPARGAGLGAGDGLRPDARRQWAVRWQWLENSYSEIEAEAASMGAGFAILLMPFRNQIEGDVSDFVQLRIQRMAAQRGWRVIDPLAAFERAFEQNTSPFMDAWHPTVEGHRLVARELVTELSCHDWLPPSARALCGLE